MLGAGLWWGHDRVGGTVVAGSCWFGGTRGKRTAATNTMTRIKKHG